MTMHSRSVAILAENTAFASILADVLKTERGHRVACFTQASALATYLILTPVDVVAFDADLADAQDILKRVRTDPKQANPCVNVVAFTRADPAFHRPLRLAGAEFVLQKPIMPGRLVAAMDSLLQDEQRSVVNWTGPKGSTLRDNGAQPVAQRDNVIPLFGRTDTPQV